MTAEPPTPYDALRQGLIWGRWKSGERLIPRRLKEELNCKNSVLREAMVRLAGEGLVVSEKNHGFRTVAHSQETFREAAHLRLVLEREAAVLALQKGDFEWEMALSAAHQKLAYVEQQMVQTGNTKEFVRHWSIQDWEFHATLLSACGSELLMRAYKSAFDTFRMYAVAEFPDFGFGQALTVHEHLAIYEAAINRDSSACIAAIDQHVTHHHDDGRSTDSLPSKTKTAAAMRTLGGNET